MRRALAGLTLVMLCALPASARAGALSVRLGALFPRAESNLFLDDRVLYTVDEDDWHGFTGGIEYSAHIASHLELGVHLDGYGRTLETIYRDYTYEDGRAIPQRLKLQMAPIGLSLRVVAGGRHAAFAPYLAVGGDVYFWEYEEWGDFIDFDDPDLPIIADAFISDGVTVGGHAAAGVRVRLNHDVSLVGEGRYFFAPTVDMEEDFRGNRLDLDGWSATLGVHVQF